MKKVSLNLICIALAIATVFVIIWSRTQGIYVSDKNYEDGIQQIDLNTIKLEASKVEVNFSNVILSNPEETRKLIVSEQKGTVSTELTQRVIEQLDVRFLKKTQKVSYTGKGYFVVDLDNLTQDRLIDDKENKTLTIQIDHAYLKAIEINPNDIIVDEVKKGLLAWGDIEVSVQDYNTIEKELRTRLEAQFNTAENGQQADNIALKMVKEVYEPVVHAIDKRYQVVVEFK